jgi:thymidylate kinase
MTHYIILISGFARSGKDTLANAIMRQLMRQKRHPHIVKFSDALKGTVQGALEALDLNGLDVFSESGADKIRTRPTLVAFAELCRSIDRDVFARITVEDISELFKGSEYPQFVIIADCRYENEDKLVRKFAKERGDIEVTRIHIQREKNQAANTEEAESLKRLNDECVQYRIAMFEDGDIQAIEDYAVMFLSDRPWGINHMNQLSGLDGVEWRDAVEKSQAQESHAREMEEIRQGVEKVSAMLTDLLNRIGRLDQGR